jgi:hypothetical protein
MLSPHHFHLSLGGDWATWLTVAATWIVAVAAMIALKQLGEARVDRHAMIMIEMGRRWEGAEMTEALKNSRHYTPEGLADLVVAARTGEMGDPMRAEAEKKLLVLMRIVNYFEDAALIGKVSGMEADLIDEYFGGVAIDEWSTWRLAIEKIQEKDKTAYEGFQKMAERDAALEEGEAAAP